MSLNNSAWPTVVDHGTTNTSTRSSVRRQAYRPNALGLFTRNTEPDFVPIGLLKRQKRNQPQTSTSLRASVRACAYYASKVKRERPTVYARPQRAIQIPTPPQSKRESLRVITRPR